jgi:hypothetical protein
VRLTYTGLTPVTFTDNRVGEKFPGDEFNLPDEDVTPFLARADVAVVEPVAPTPALMPAVLPSLSIPVVPDVEPDPEPPAADEAADEPVADEATTDPAS